MVFVGKVVFVGMVNMVVLANIVFGMEVGDMAVEDIVFGMVRMVDSKVVEDMGMDTGNISNTATGQMEMVVDIVTRTAVDI